VATFTVALSRSGPAVRDDEALIAPRIPLLDSVRALAVIALGAYDVAWGGARVDGRLAPLAERLNVVALPMFMVLSGFLLYRPHLAARRWGVAPPSLRSFALRRVLRIAPAYWAALIVIAAASGLPGDVLGGRFWVYFGFLQTYADWHGLQGMAHTWTVALAVAFSVFIAAWALAFRHRRFRLWRELALCALLIAGSLSLQFQYQAAQGRWGNFELTLPALLFPFAAGMGLAALSVAADGREQRSTVVRAVRAMPGLWWLAAVVAYAWLCYGAGLPPRGAPITEYSSASWATEQGIGALVATLVIVPVVFGMNSTGLPRLLLSSPALLALGRLSYGVYLWHVAVLSWVQTVFMPRRSWDSMSLELLLTLAVSALIAAVSWVVVEKPFLQLAHRRPAAPHPDQAGDAQRQGRRGGDAAQRPSRSLGIAWQDHVPTHLGGQHRGSPGRCAPAGLGAGDGQRDAGAVGAVHRDQLGGGAGGGEQVAVVQPGGGEVGGVRLEQPVLARHVDQPGAAGEPGRDGGEPLDARRG
jgi:peptidoglycan/LPS O-acetylase OafA/YrhL